MLILTMKIFHLDFARSLTLKGEEDYRLVEKGNLLQINLINVDLTHFVMSHNYERHPARPRGPPANFDEYLRYFIVLLFLCIYLPFQLSKVPLSEHVI